MDAGRSHKTASNRYRSDGQSMVRQHPVGHARTLDLPRARMWVDQRCAGKVDVGRNTTGRDRDSDRSELDHRRQGNRRQQCPQGKADSKTGQS